MTQLPKFLGLVVFSLMVVYAFPAPSKMHTPIYTEWASGRLGEKLYDGATFASHIPFEAWCTSGDITTEEYLSILQRYGVKYTPREGEVLTYVVEGVPHYNTHILGNLIFANERWVEEMKELNNDFNHNKHERIAVYGNIVTSEARSRVYGCKDIVSHIADVACALFYGTVIMIAGCFVVVGLFITASSVYETYLA